MKNVVDNYLKLAKLFSQNGFSLYIVGGSVRDFLLQKELKDLDFVTDATPSEMSMFIKDINMKYASLGSVKVKIDKTHYDITTLRIEDKYDDSRHPSKITFIKDLKLDSYRRDFTINAMYLDNRFKLYDFHNGEKDLNNKIIRMIGKAKKRIKEDPLRILRAIRFSLRFNFVIDTKLDKTLYKCHKLLDKISLDKIHQEIKKMDDIDNDLLLNTFKKYKIEKYLIK